MYNRVHCDGVMVVELT